MILAIYWICNQQGVEMLSGAQLQTEELRWNLCFNYSSYLATWHVIEKLTQPTFIYSHKLIMETPKPFVKFAQIQWWNYFQKPIE